MPICATPTDTPEAVYIRTAILMCQLATRQSLVQSLADVFAFWVDAELHLNCAAAVAAISTQQCKTLSSMCVNRAVF